MPLNLCMLYLRCPWAETGSEEGIGTGNRNFISFCFLHGSIKNLQCCGPL